MKQNVKCSEKNVTLPRGLYKVSFFFFSNTISCLLLSSLLTGRFYWFLIFFFFPLSPRDQMRITQQPAQCTLLRYVQSSSSEQTACKLHTSVCGFLWWKKEKKSFWLSFTEVRVRVVAHSNNNGQQRVLCDLISSVSLAIWAVFVSFFHLRRLTFGFKSEYIGTQTQASKDAA